MAGEREKPAPAWFLMLLGGMLVSIVIGGLSAWLTPTASSVCVAHNPTQILWCLSGCDTMTGQEDAVAACDSSCLRNYCSKREMKLNTGTWCKNAKRAVDLTACFQSGYRADNP